ncbi:LysR family transcriptional regulator [Cognatishimia sp.]|uniref:LysR family transcriptional regulator n=1 Tax=Cognatishimia sp. TaxID=2211648 RepID=UPI0035130D97|nr:LysR family transcriptional regulator [Cognatishimia sp.]
MDWRHLPPIPALRAFAAFAEKRNLVEAGAVLNVTHAAISQQLRQLESHIGVSLLRRQGRNLELTPEGERLAAAILAGFEGIAQTVAELTGREEDRPVQVTLPPTVASQWLMPRLGGFMAQYPGIEVLLNTSAQIVQLEPGGVDLAMRYCDGAWPGLDCELLFAAPLAIVGSPDLVGDGDYKDPADLACLPWLEELGHHEATEWLESFGVTQSDRVPGLHVPGNLMLDGARNGQGVAMICRAFVEGDIAAGRLRVLHEIDNGKGYYLCGRPGVKRAAVQAFRKWILKEAKTLAAA